MPAAAIPAVAMLGSSMIGADQARSARNDAKSAYQDALRSLGGVYVPTVEEQQLVLQHPELVGQYDPIMEQTPDQMSSAMEGLSTDPRLAEIQRQTLENIAAQGQGGMTPEDRAMLDQIQRSVAGDYESRSKGILQNMAQRGMGGSGQELAAKLAAAQQAADLSSQQGLSVAAQGQRRGLEALSQAGSLAGQQREQQFGEEANIAKAKDLIAQFNLQNSLQTNRNNVGEQRAAQAANLSERQRIADQTNALRNQQEQQNKQLIQQRYANELGHATGQVAPAANYGQYMQNQAGATGQNWANIGSGIGSAYTALAAKPAPAQQYTQMNNGTYMPYVKGDEEIK